MVILPYWWRGGLIRTLLARGSRGLCPLLAVSAHLQHAR
jgi:hypothetical protein